MPLWIDHAELEAYLIFSRAPKLGSARLRRLRERAGSMSAAKRDGIQLWRECGLSEQSIEAILHPNLALLEADLRWLSQSNQHAISFEQLDYPPQLKRIKDAPELLFVAGDPIVLWTTQIAIVGSRNASQSGLETAQDFAQSFAHSGWTVTSGLALGIDGAAHAAAIDANAASVAVLGTGVDVIYPARHKALAERLVEHGAIVSELPLGTLGQRENFPRRNRIISGLSLGVLVVEAGLQSGSLITARDAAEQGREVFAIPGSIHHPLARGCHQLIREGAKLVETAQEVIDELASLARDLGIDIQIRLNATSEASSMQNQNENETGKEKKSVHFASNLAKTKTPVTHYPNRKLDPEYQALFKALGPDPANIDRLCARSGLNAAQISSMLVLLELDGQVENLGGGRYQVRAGSS